MNILKSFKQIPLQTYIFYYYFMAISLFYSFFTSIYLKAKNIPLDQEHSFYSVVFLAVTLLLLLQLFLLYKVVKFFLTPADKKTFTFVFDSFVLFLNISIVSMIISFLSLFRSNQFSNLHTDTELFFTLFSFILRIALIFVTILLFKKLKSDYKFSNTRKLFRKNLGIK